MRQLLVINPNMSAHVSALLQRHVRGAAGSHVAVRTATARFGAPYIACEASYAVAVHTALDMWAHEIAQPQTPPDAVLIGCFGDPGLMALRESSPVPVTGLAKASIIEAARHGRFAIVTGGERWGPMLQRLAQALGHAHALAGIHTVAPTGRNWRLTPRQPVPCWPRPAGTWYARWACRPSSWVAPGWQAWLLPCSRRCRCR